MKDSLRSRGRHRDDQTERPVWVLLQLPVNSPAHRPVAVYRGGKPCRFHPKKHKFHRCRFHFFHFNRQTSTRGQPLPFSCPPPCSYLTDCAACWREQLQRRVSGARLAETHLWKKVSWSFGGFFSQTPGGGGVKGDKMPRPNKTNRKASPGSPVHPLHGLTMVTMEPICQFNTSWLCEERRAPPSAPSLMFDRGGEGAPQTRAEDACVS